MEHAKLILPDLPQPLTDPTFFHRISYGLAVITARENGKDNGFICNTVSQIASSPDLVSVSINKANHTCKMIRRTGKMNVNILSESAPFSLFERFGFKSGKDTDKMLGLLYGRSENNLPVLREDANAFCSLKVKSAIELPSHYLFLCTVEESAVLNKTPSMTYAFYHKNVKPAPKKENKKGWVCKICGYIHEEETFPEGFLCPLCKHPPSDFERIKG